MVYRQYSEDEIAQTLAVLQANRGNARRTSAQTGVALTTLRGWAGRVGDEKRRTAPAAQLTTARETLARQWRAVTEILLAEALRRKDGGLERASVKDLLIGAGIGTDKEQLLTGGPTSRNEQVKVSLMSGPSLRERSRAQLRVLPGRKEVQEVG